MGSPSPTSPPTLEASDRPRSAALRLRAPLLGRTQELALLEDTLSETLATSTPHTITLMGGPGVGKSRLCREFLADARVRHEQLLVLNAQCREGGDPFGVIKALLRARLGLSDGSDHSVTEQALRQVVTQVMGDRRVGEFMHFLGAFLDLNLSASALAQAVSSDPAQLRQVGRSVLRHFLEADAARQPLVLVFEDFELAHGDTAQLVHYLVQSVSAAPILFVIVARPELLGKHPEWLDLGGAAIRFDLAPLSPDDTAEMVDQLLKPAGELPAELVDEAVELASGNPYLVEQIVRAFIDQGVITTHPTQRWKIELGRLGRVRLPLNVEDAIQAHLAALSPDEKNVLEMAAALGGVFWLGALVSLGRAGAEAPRLWSDPGADRRRLRELLDDLIERDYILRLPDSSIPGEVEYAFKHNLEREALHRYTGRNLLVRYHQAIAQWLELHLTESSEEQHDMLAQHYEQAGIVGRAAQHFLLAAERARTRYAAGRAAEYYGHGLRLLGEGEGMLRLCSLQHWGETLQLSGDTAAARGAFESMRVLAYQLDLPALAASAHASLGRLDLEQGALDTALEQLDAAHALCEHAGDRAGSAAAVETLATLHAARGNHAAAEHLIGEAIDTFEQLGQLGYKAQLAAALRSSGEIAALAPDAATSAAARERWVSHFERSMELFDELGHVLELARSARAFADRLDPAAGGAAQADVDRARSLRARSRELLDRHKGITIRASLGPAKV